MAQPTGQEGKAQQTPRQNQGLKPRTGAGLQALVLAGGLLGFSLLTGWLSHFVALNKYLRLESDQLH